MSVIAVKKEYSQFTGKFGNFSKMKYLHFTDKFGKIISSEITENVIFLVYPFFWRFDFTGNFGKRFFWCEFTDCFLYF